MATHHRHASRSALHARSTHHPNPLELIDRGLRPRCRQPDCEYWTLGMDAFATLGLHHVIDRDHRDPVFHIDQPLWLSRSARSPLIVLARRWTVRANRASIPIRIRCYAAGASSRDRPPSGCALCASSAPTHHAKDPCREASCCRSTFPWDCSAERL